MPPGRPAKPTELKRLEGNPGNRPLNEDEPTYPAANISPPDWLSGLGIVEWQRLAPKLIEHNLLTEADLTAFAMYCEWYRIYREALAELRSEGLTIQGARGVVRNPVFQVMRDAADGMKLAQSKFGLTPSDRVKLSTGKVEIEDIDALLAQFDD